MSVVVENEQKPVWEMEKWDPAPTLPKARTLRGIEVCPYVGLKLPKYPSEWALKRAWFSKQEMRSWYIKPLRRRALYNLMRRNLRNWSEWLRLDSTNTFDRELKDYQKFNDGATVGITGPKGSGKSRLAQMVLNRAVDTIPHVIFEYKDLEINIPQRGQEAVGIQVDENLKATGSDSKNLVIHVNNALDTGRKAELWVICTGINLSFQGWGDTLDIRMIPFGFNRRFQATRAAFFDVKNDFLGFCAAQRVHAPKDSVYYYTELGTWDEYEARARAYSLKVTRKGGATDAIDDTTQDRHVAAMKDYLKVRYVDKHLKLPTDLMCRRLYRKAKLPPKSIGYMNEVIAWAKFELEDEPAARGGQGEEGQGLPVPYIENSENWNILRNLLIHALSGIEFEGMNKIDAIVGYMVPDHQEETAEEVLERLKVSRCQPDTLRKYFRNGKEELRKKDLDGDIGEWFLHKSWASHIDYLGAVWGIDSGAGHGKSDLIVGDTHFNIKLSFAKKSPRQVWTTTPEHEHSDSHVILIWPHRLKVCIHPITGPTTYINPEEGKGKGRLYAIEEGAERIKEMIER